jgi:hypothetical protein
MTSTSIRVQPLPKEKRIRVIFETRLDENTTKSHHWDLPLKQAAAFANAVASEVAALEATRGPDEGSEHKATP